MHIRQKARFNLVVGSTAKRKDEVAIKAGACGSG